MQHASGGLVQTLLGLPVFRSEWVLYLLLGLSLASVAVMVERWFFYRSHRVDADSLRAKLSDLLAAGDFGSAAKLLQGHDSLETNIVLAGLKAYELGPESAEELIAGALGKEKGRYEKRLNFLATLASNAPYVGLFGTVLGIVRSFRNLGADLAEAHAGVMTALAEALVATAIGLLVAIPAVVAFNAFKTAVKGRVTRAETW